MDLVCCHIFSVKTSSLSKTGPICCHIFPVEISSYQTDTPLMLIQVPVCKDSCKEIDLCDCRQPVILPFFHSGMGRVLPKGSVRPRLGNVVTVLVGEPLDLSDITCNCNRNGVDQQQVQPLPRFHSLYCNLLQTCVALKIILNVLRYRNLSLAASEPWKSFRTGSSPKNFAIHWCVPRDSSCFASQDNSPAFSHVSGLQEPSCSMQLPKGIEPIHDR